MTSLALLLSLAAQPAAEIDTDAAADGMIAEVRELLDDPSKPMRLLVTFEVKADREQDFVDLFKMATKKTRTEDGNITYHMSKVAGTLGEGEPGNPTYVLFETWKSLDALDAHMHTEYLAEVLTKLPELVESSTIAVMQPQLQREHRKGRGDVGGADNSGIPATGRRMKKKDEKTAE